MLFLVCLLLFTGFSYGMNGAYYDGYSSKDNSEWLKKRRKENKKMEEAYKERVRKEEKLKIKNEKQQAKQEKEQKKLQEKEKTKLDKMQRQLDKKIANTKPQPQAGTLGFVGFLTRSRAELPRFDGEDKTKTL